MPVSVIQTLNRMAAADGITPQPATGVPTDIIRDHPTAASHLPTYFRPPNTVTYDPIDTMRDMGAGVLELADEIGMEPQQDDTVVASRDDPAWTIAHGEEGGVPRNDDSNHLPNAIDTNTHGDRGGDTENEQCDCGSGDIRGDIRGADNMDEHIGGAEHYDGDGIRRVGDDNGDHHRSRGDTAEGEPTAQTHRRREHVCWTSSGRGELI